MISGMHVRIDRLPRRTRSKLYYAVGLSASSAAWLIDARSSSTAAYLVLLAAAVFLLMRLLRELRPGRLAGPPEMRLL